MEKRHKFRDWSPLLNLICLKKIKKSNNFIKMLLAENVDWEIHVDRLRMIHRKEWGAVLPRRRFYLQLPVRNVIFIYNTWHESCCTDKECFRVLQEMQDYEMKKVGGPDVKYKYVVCCSLLCLLKSTVRRSSVVLDGQGLFQGGTGNAVLQDEESWRT